MVAKVRTMNLREMSEMLQEDMVLEIPTIIRDKSTRKSQANLPTSTSPKSIRWLGALVVSILPRKNGEARSYELSFSTNIIIICSHCLTVCMFSIVYL